MCKLSGFHMFWSQSYGPPSSCNWRCAEDPFHESGYISCTNFMGSSSFMGISWGLEVSWAIHGIVKFHGVFMLSWSFMGISWEVPKFHWLFMAPQIPLKLYILMGFLKHFIIANSWRWISPFSLLFLHLFNKFFLYFLSLLGHLLKSGIIFSQYRNMVHLVFS